MKKVFIIFALMAIGAFAHAADPVVGLVRCMEHNEKLNADFDFVIHSDLALTSGKGIIVSHMGELSTVYNVDLQGTVDSKNMTLKATYDTESTTEVIYIDLSATQGLGSRTVSIKEPYAGYLKDTVKGPLTYSLKCERLF
jgi:hypothetical protein